MGLEIQRLEKETPLSTNRQIANRRLYWNADHTMLVEEGDVRGAFLACAPGDPIPETKAADKTEDKAAPKSQNKGKK
jgi:hypothetical protein